MIELYGFASVNVMKIRIMLEELDLNYEYRAINVFAAEQFTEEFTNLNPNNRVPVIIDTDGPEGPITIFESGAILIYLAQKYGRFLSNKPADLYSTLQWLMFQMASVGPMIGQLNHFLRSAPPGNDYAHGRYATEAKRIFDVLERRLAQSEFLGCSDYSIADIATFPWVRLYDVNKIEISHLPNVNRWLNVLSARPAVAKVLDYWPALLAADQERKDTAKEVDLDRLFGRGKFLRA